MLVKENLFNKSKVKVGQCIDENNGIVSKTSIDTPHIITGYKPCKNYSNIQFTNIKEIHNLRYVFFDENKNYITGGIFKVENQVNINVPENAYYIRFSFRNDDNTPVNLDRVFITYEEYDNEALYIQAKDYILEEDKEYHRLGKFNQIQSL